MRIKRFLSILSFFTFLTASSGALAFDETLFGRVDDAYGVKIPGLTFSMFTGIYSFGYDQRLYDTSDRISKAWNLGLRAGFALSRYAELEASFGFTPTRGATADQDVYMYSFNGIGQYPFLDELVPYATMGIGGVRYTWDDRVLRDAFALNYGAGLKWFFFRNLALRPDVRGLTSFDPDKTAFLVTLNLTYYLALRADAKKAKPVVLEPPPPAPTPVPASPPPPKPSPEATPVPAPQASPTPEPKFSAEAVSQLKEFTGIIEGIRFTSNSARIRSESHAILDRAAAFFKQHPNLKVRIEGNTDDTGGINTNVRLSRKRASSVLSWFMSRGVDPKNFETVGYGSSRPVASNATGEGRAQNRRIEFKVLNPEAL